MFLLFLEKPVQSASLDWDGIKDHYRRSTANDYVEYLQLLSIREESDTLETLTYKKSAIAYFMATGGPQGFNKRQATPEEREIMLKSLSFAASLHETLGDEDDFSLLAVRRSCGRQTETETERAHLLFSQTAITATRILINAGKTQDVSAFVTQTRELYRQECLPVLRLSFSDPQEQVEEFTKVFTQKLAKEVSLIFKCIHHEDGVSNNPVLLSKGPLVTFSETYFQNYLKTCLDLSPSAHEIPDFSLNRTLANGLIVERRKDGSLNLRATRPLRLGRILLTPSVEYETSIQWQEGDLKISKYQDEKDFLESLSAVSTILKTGNN